MIATIMNNREAVAAAGVAANVSATRTQKTPTIKMSVAMEKERNNVCPLLPIYSLIIVPIDCALWRMDACKEV